MTDTTSRYIQGPPGPDGSPSIIPNPDYVDPYAAATAAFNQHGQGLHWANGMQQYYSNDELQNMLAGAQGNIATGDGSYTPPSNDPNDPIGLGYMVNSSGADPLHFDPTVGTWVHANGKAATDQEFSQDMLVAEKNQADNAKLGWMDYLPLAVIAAMTGGAALGALPEVAGVGAAAAGGIDAGLEAGMLGGSAVGTGTELTAAQLAAGGLATAPIGEAGGAVDALANSTIGTDAIGGGGVDTLASQSPGIVPPGGGGGVDALTTQSPSVTPPGGGGGVDSLTSHTPGVTPGSGGGGVDKLISQTPGITPGTTPGTGLPPGSSSLLPKLISALTGTTPTGATGSSSLGNIGGSTSNNYGSTNSAVAAGAVAPQGAPSAQMQQIASLLLQDPNQPNFNPLAYQQAPDAMTPEMTQRVAQQLQAPGQDAYFG